MVSLPFCSAVTFLITIAIHNPRIGGFLALFKAVWLLVIPAVIVWVGAVTAPTQRFRTAVLLTILGATLYTVFLVNDYRMFGGNNGISLLAPCMIVGIGASIFVCYRFRRQEIKPK
jgi:hypothetical protein